MIMCWEGDIILLYMPKVFSAAITSSESDSLIHVLFVLNSGQLNYKNKFRIQISTLVMFTKMAFLHGPLVLLPLIVLIYAQR